MSRYREFEIGSPFPVYVFFVFVFYYWWRSTELKNPSGLPVVGRRWYELGNGKARQRIRDDCLGIVRSCLAKVSDTMIPISYLGTDPKSFSTEQYGDAFYLYTDSRYRLILSGKYVDMLRNEKRLDFITALADVRKLTRMEKSNQVLI